MRCDAIISPPTAILEKTDTLAHALTLLQDHGVTSLPVVDSKGHYVGGFGLRELIALVVPRAVRAGVETGAPGVASDSLADLHHRVQAFAQDPVGKRMAAYHAVRPETPLVEALMLLYRSETDLPVVDGTGKLVGMITAQSALKRVVQGA